VEPNPELRLEDARSLREGLWRMAQLVQDAAETLDERIEDENMDGATEAEELREALERVQSLSLEISEELDAYQDQHAR
jgi:phosphate uptake regulator